MRKALEELTGEPVGQEGDTFKVSWHGAHADVERTVLSAVILPRMRHLIAGRRT